MRIRTAYRRWFLPGVILSATVIIFLSVCGLYIYFNKPGVISIGWSQIRCESLQPANVHDSRPDSKHRNVKSYFSAADSRALLDELDAVDATARLEVDEYEIIFAEEMTRKSRAAQLQSPTFPFESDSLLRAGRVALAVGALSKVLKYWNVERLFAPMARTPNADANRISGDNASFFVLSGYHAIRNGYVRRQNSGRINFFAQPICSSNPQSGGIYLTALISALQRISFFQSHKSEHTDATGTHIAGRRIELCTYINQRV